MTPSNKQAIVFAFFKGDKLVGYRQDTMGSIGTSPKIYHYSEEQVKTVLGNVFHNIEEARKDFVTEVTEAASSAAEHGGLALIFSNISKRTGQMVKDLGEFEVRVLPCPDYKEGYVYPTEDILDWMRGPVPEAIETHKFKV